MDRRVQWKSKPLKYESQEATRQVRADHQQARRQNKREEQLNRLRCVSPVDDEEIFEDTPEDRAIRLEKWKKERELKKKLESKKKRPAFVIGVPHHNFYSPASRDPAKPHCHRKPKGLSPPKRLTAVTQRRLAARTASTAVTPAVSPLPSARGIRGRQKPTIPDNRSQMPVTRTRKKVIEAEKQKSKTHKQLDKYLEEDLDKDERKLSLAPQNYEFKGPTGIAPMPLFGTVFIPDTDGDPLNFNITTHSASKKKDRPQLKTLTEQNEKTPIKTVKLPRRTSSQKTIQHNSETTTHQKSSPMKMKKSASKRTSIIKKSLKTPDIAMRRQGSMKSDTSIESVVLRMSSESAPLIDMDEKTSQGKENMSIIRDSSCLPKNFSPVPAQYSPFIVTSRGKSSARKEQKQRLSLHKGNSPGDDIPTKDTIMQTLNISAEEEKNTSQYYKHLLKTEQDRLISLCDSWKPIQEDQATPEDGVYMINQAIGQTNLLIAKKFSRFATLVSNCETGNGEQLVRCADLQGFWEMMEMEIRDCNSRFAKLDQLKSEGWKEEEEHVEVKIPKKRAAPKKSKIEGKSNMRSFIEALRKKKVAAPVENTMEIPDEPKVVEKHCVLTPRKKLSKPVSPHSRAKLTPSTERTSLLKLVQLTESAKKMTQNSFAIVKVSHKAKTPEVTHDQSISYINSHQTPGKGILKKNPEDSMTSEGRLGKLAHKVNFNDTVDMTELPMEELDGVEQTRRSLAAGLAIIDALDFGHDDQDACVNKKLEFEDDDATDDDDVLRVIPDDEDDDMKDVSTPKLSPAIDEASSPRFDSMPPPKISKSSRTKKSNAANKLIPPTITLVAPTPVSKITRRRSSRQKHINEVKTNIETIEITTPDEISGVRNDRVNVSPSVTPEHASAKITPKGKRIQSQNASFSSSNDESSAVGKNSLPEVAISSAPVRRQLRNREILVDRFTSKKHRNSANKESALSVIVNDSTSYLDNTGSEEILTEIEHHKVHSFEGVINVDSTKVRRSTRRSARFLPDNDCTTCKPVPLTPRSLRARISFFGDSELVSQPLPNGDLMAFDSPRTPGGRLRSSNVK